MATASAPVPRSATRATPKAYRPHRVAKLAHLGPVARFLYGLGGVVVVLAVWEAAYRFGWVNKLDASSPSQIWEGGRSLQKAGLLWPAITSTAKVFAIGFGISLVSGLVIGVLLGWYRRLDAVLDPWVSILYATPRFALLPVIVIWAGTGLNSQIVVVWLISVFPIIINTSSGVAAIDRQYFRLAQSYLASNKDVLLTVALPGAVPTIIAGVRQGLVQGLTGVVVAEYFFGNTGVGGLIFTTGLQLQTGQAFFGAALFAIAAIVLSALLKMFERRVDRWRA